MTSSRTRFAGPVGKPTACSRFSFDDGLDDDDDDLPAARAVHDGARERR
jgi:hypothetical protein